MSEEFSHIFFNDHYRYRHIFLYLVTTAYRAAMKYGSFEKYTKPVSYTHLAMEHPPPFQKERKC